MTNYLRAASGAIMTKRAHVVRDLKGLVDEAETLLKEVVNAGGDEIASLEGHMEDRLNEARARLAVARRRLGQAVDVTHEYVVDNPWKILGAVAVAGLVIGAVLRTTDRHHTRI